MKQDWIIYGITEQGEKIVHEKECAKPARTKEYRELRDRFDMVGDLRAFGYLTKQEVIKQQGWITTDTFVKIL